MKWGSALRRNYEAVSRSTWAGTKLLFSLCHSQFNLNVILQLELSLSYTIIGLDVARDVLVASSSSQCGPFALFPCGAKLTCLGICDAVRADICMSCCHLLYLLIQVCTHFFPTLFLVCFLLSPHNMIMVLVEFETRSTAVHKVQLMPLSTVMPPVPSSSSLSTFWKHAACH